MNTKFYTLIILSVAALNLAVAEPLVHLTMEDYYLAEVNNTKRLCTPENVCRWMPREGLYSDPWLSDDAYIGSNSLVIQLPAAEGNPNVAGRHELFVIHPNEEELVLRFGEKKYFGFAMKLDELAFDAPLNWCLFMQVFQDRDNWTGQPPLALHFKEGQENPLQFELKTHNTAFGPFATRYTGDIERGRWYEFVLGLKPGYNNDGTIEIWLDGVKVYDEQLDWGAEPGIYDNEGEDIEIYDSFNFRVGLYRREQPRTFTVHYDEIKYADNFLDAVPGCGDGGFLLGDINRDCDVDLLDFAILAQDWLQSTNPTE